MFLFFTLLNLSNMTLWFKKGKTFYRTTVCLQVSYSTLQILMKDYFPEIAAQKITDNIVSYI